VLAAAAVVASLVGIVQASHWRTYLLWMHGGAFGVTEPFFGHDVGFFVFALPAYQALLGAGLAIAVCAGIVAAVVFWLHGAIDFRRPNELAAPHVLGTMSLVLALYLALRAVGFVIGRYELLL